MDRFYTRHVCWSDGTNRMTELWDGAFDNRVDAYELDQDAERALWVLNNADARGEEKWFFLSSKSTFEEYNLANGEIVENASNIFNEFADNDTSPQPNVDHTWTMF